MEPTYYTVQSISSDYAMLLSDNGIENMVALALLPDDIADGMRLLWENFEYFKL